MNLKHDQVYAARGRFILEEQAGRRLCWPRIVVCFLQGFSPFFFPQASIETFKHV